MAVLRRENNPVNIPKMEFPDENILSSIQTPFSTRSYKTPTIVQVFVVVSVLLILILLIVGKQIPSTMSGLFTLSSALSIVFLTSFALYAFAKLNAQKKHLKELLNVDRTTGLYSSAFLMEELDRLIAEEHRDLTLIFLDLDELKVYNDRYGHRAGDRLIREAAEALVEPIAGRGIGFRYGGDEFVALLPDVSKEEAVIMAKRIHSAFKDREISASIGVYSWRPGLNSDGLLHEADKAMYTAKRSGKGHLFIGGNHSLEIDGKSSGIMIE